MKRVAVSAVALALFPLSSVAENYPAHHRYPDHDHDRDDVKIDVLGKIAAKCAVHDGPENLDLGNLTEPGRKAFTLIVNCNAPFSYTLESHYGALANTTHGPVSGGGFSDRLAYTISTRIPTDTGVISDECLSADIRSGATSCHFSDSGTGVAMPSTARFALSWTASEAILLAGNYQDQLTLTFAVRP